MFFYYITCLGVQMLRHRLFLAQLIQPRSSCAVNAAPPRILSTGPATRLCHVESFRGYTNAALLALVVYGLDDSQ